MLGRESAECKDVGAGIMEHRGDFGMGALQHPGDFVELGLDVLRVGLGEDGADDGGDHVLTGTRDDGENISNEMDPTALPRSALEHRANGLLQAGVSVGDDELDTVQPPGFQGPQELSPERLVLTVTDVEPEDLAATVGGHTDGWRVVLLGTRSPRCWYCRSMELVLRSS